MEEDTGTGTSNTGNPQDNSFRNVDKLPLGNLLQSSFGRGRGKRTLSKLRDKGMPEKSSFQSLINNKK